MFTKKRSIVIFRKKYAEMVKRGRIFCVIIDIEKVETRRKRNGKDLIVYFFCKK